MKIGVIAMSAKPYHRGHHELIKKASNECDQVHIFVSISNRKRSGEPVVLGTDMHHIWRSYIEPALPKNVKITYGGSPVSNVYTFIGNEGLAGSTDVYVIFSDPDDLDKSFPEKSLEKYFGDQYLRGHVILEPVQRSETVNVSGTQMRHWVDTNDQESFIDMLPDHIAQDPKACDDVWNRLRNSALNIKRPKKRKR